MSDKTRQRISPPILAARWGVSPEKVIAWIESGELSAINAATRPGGRPRYLIDEADLADFEARRSVQPEKTTKPRKRESVPYKPEFFK